MRIQCTTNLDLVNEQWPNELPVVPMIGDYIRSKTKWGTSNPQFQLELEVVSVTWKYSDGFPGCGIPPCWIPVVELHVKRSRKWSITDFYNWYAPLVGRSVGSFI